MSNHKPGILNNYIRMQIRAHTDEEKIDQSEITPGQIFIRSF